MGLWDLISGRTVRRGIMGLKATGRVCRGLRSFVMSKLVENPEAEQDLNTLRNLLYAYYFGATCVLNTSLDTTFRDYKRQIMSLNVDNYLHFIGTFHITQNIATHASEAGLPFLRISSEGICNMYGFPLSYVRQWEPIVALLVEKEPNAGAKVVDKTYEQIAPILGLPLQATSAALFWAQAAIQFGVAARKAYELPNWPRVVESEMAAHP